jgi:OPA family glycerol-3-phosphate transporter-like MFS transporter
MRTPPASPKNLALWQGLTLSLLFLGYAGYYLCRSDLSVTLPLIIDELASQGMTPAAAKIHVGQIVSWGVFAYAVGKFLLGGTADLLGGKRNFLAGMGGAILFTFVFGLGGGLPIFTLAWIGNRISQSVGWAGMVKISSKWFSYASYGTVMGVISVSYLFGDAASRYFMGFLIHQGVGWRSVFFIAGGTLAVILLLNLVLLRESRTELGFSAPEVNPLNLFSEAKPERVPSAMELLRPLSRSYAFWLVCALSFGTTIVRETFGTWTPTYFHQALGFSQSEAANQSAWFPLLGGISVLLAGFLSDRLGKNGRAAIMFWGLLLSAGALAALGFLNFGHGRLLPVVLVSLVGFLVLGPYSYLAGAIALDFGGSQGSATTSALIDSAGYVGGILAGDTVARISVSYGWEGAFLGLAGVAVMSAIAAAMFLVQQRKAATA